MIRAAIVLSLVLTTLPVVAQPSVLMLRNPFQPFTQSVSRVSDSSSSQDKAEASKETIEEASAGVSPIAPPTLQSIAINSRGRALALINNTIVSVDDTIDDFIVKAIGITFVTLARNDEVLTLRLTPVDRGASTSLDSSADVIPHTGIPYPPETDPVSLPGTDILQNLGQMDQLISPMLEFLYPELVPLEDREP